MKVWIDGKFTDAKDAKMSVFDRGLLYGDGLFETMRSYNGKIFRIDEHLSRLFRASKVVKLRIPYSKMRIRHTLERSLKTNGLKDAYARLTVTRGGSKPSVIIITKALDLNPARYYSRGITAEISDIRQNELTLLSGIKTLNFMGHMLARAFARDRGFDDAILINSKGNIAEGATSNIFSVKGGVISTPSCDSGILPGITRGVVIEIAGLLKLKVREKKITPKELISSDELFLTSSISEIVPVVKVGSHMIGRRVPGKMTKLLHALYRKMV